MTQKYQICHQQIRFFHTQNAPKSVFGRWGSLRRSPRAYDAPPDPLVGWGGGFPLPIPLPALRLWHLELGAYGASVLRPPSTQNPGYASGSVVLSFGRGAAGPEKNERKNSSSEMRTMQK